MKSFARNCFTMITLAASLFFSWSVNASLTTYQEKMTFSNGGEFDVNFAFDTSTNDISQVAGIYHHANSLNDNLVITNGFHNPGLFGPLNFEFQHQDTATGKFFVTIFTQFIADQNGILLFDNTDLNSSIHNALLSGRNNLLEMNDARDFIFGFFPTNLQLAVVTPVPLPSAFPLLASTLMGFALLRRRNFLHRTFVGV